MGEKFCSASFLQITAADLSDRALEAFLAVDSSLIVSMHIQRHRPDGSREDGQAQDHGAGQDEDRGAEDSAVRSGYDMDILPVDLTTLRQRAQRHMLKSLQSRNERMLLLTFTRGQRGGQPSSKLEGRCAAGRSIAQTHELLRW